MHAAKQTGVGLPQQQSQAECLLNRMTDIQSSEAVCKSPASIAHCADIQRVKHPPQSGKV